MAETSTQSMKLLILGGTRDALDLGRLLIPDERLNVITSLAGRTEEPDRSIGNTRKGGFGGVEGLVKFLNNEAIDLLVDSTHPFATRISKNAIAAASKANCKLIRLNRPQWEETTGDDWTICNDVEEAANALPAGATVFLALGHQYIDAFNHRDDCTFFARMIDAPAQKLELPNHTLVLGKPELAAQAEANLFKSHGITHLVCRNSGGDLVYGKIEAARELSIPVLMIKRPPQPASKSFDSVDEVAVYIFSQLS